ncbi:ABC transporter substrate-binding protein [Thermomonospora cellulosilytica]|uniref:ABC-type branched-subunit amino acid transport system substrate-binding protein n=1 Tax=Thermomonospora cellulosilytica TaxID=1411118 RepID=A0A7W3MZG0_9ACTN|nr:ABC transporter substrate-binding protein [Thermomonospora cellulosilytica]MBA9004721.1 ABC-type branched-subunit amino acid transport system substrate-binding protein [Thermomonospora cellulosilytica]
MPRAFRPGRLGTAVAALVLALSACGGSAEDPAGAGAPGVTDEPCPNAVDKSKGCIYLGVISDLTSGPFHLLGAPTTKAQQAFWRRVNQQGGIAGYEIDVTRYVVDSKYDVDTHQRLYRQIRGRVLAMAQTLGSSHTARILPELRADKMIAVPASWSSAWEFEDVILESGVNYCFESMNAVDYAVDSWRADSVMVVHFDNDYGKDAVAGARAAAQRRKLSFKTVATPPGADKQAAAVAEILAERPDAVLLAVGPAEVGGIVSQAVKQGYRGRFIGSTPSWSRTLLELKDPQAVTAIKQSFWKVSPWKPYAADTPGHSAMRAVLGLTGSEPNDNYTSGWVWSYPLKAVIQRAAANGELTREGLLKAMRQVTRIDYEGMLPAEAGDFSGDPDSAAFRGSLMSVPDAKELTGIRITRDFFVGPTAKGHRLTAPCAPLQ